MPADVVRQAVELAGAIRETARRRAFEKAVRGFVQLLATVPDHPAREFSGEQIEVLRTLAESVIDRIEERISVDDDPASVQMELAGAVYEIRRRLENIDQWRRHFHVGP